MTIYGMSWDASIYTGLRQFHRAKGFDPDSQDVARHLGKPIYQLAREMDIPFAHGLYTTYTNHAVPPLMINTSG
jgi:hypothetical protein